MDRKQYMREYYKKYYQEHKEREKARTLKYYQDNRDKLTEKRHEKYKDYVESKKFDIEKNSPKLSILITRYKEPEKVLRPLLDSIKIQQGINFNDIEVVIGQDGLEQKDLSQGFINNYGRYFPLKYVKFEHGGISVLRNHLLDIARGEYIEFCDDDDMFSSILALRLILEKIENGGFDILFSTFTEEVFNKYTNRLEYAIHKDDCVFVHGKVYNRQFVIDNNIRFKDEIQLHEDVYFVAQCYHCSNPAKRVFINSSFYMWKWRDNSIVRSDNQWLLWTYHILLDCNNALIENFISRGMTKQAQMTSLVMTFNLYYKINSPEFMRPENAKRVLEIEKHFKPIYLKYVDYMDSMPADMQQRLVHEIRRKACSEHGLVIEHITFEDWIKHILELED